MTLKNIAKKTLMSIRELVNLTYLGDDTISTPLGNIQRDYIWTNEMNQSLIEAILDDRLEKSFVIVDYGGDSKCLVIDGKQRLKAIRDYLLSLTDGVEERKFKSLPVSVYVIEAFKLNKPLTLSEIAKIFLTVNATGVPQNETHLELIKQISNSNL
jgi:Protein of unknown function DUF262